MEVEQERDMHGEGEEPSQRRRRDSKKHGASRGGRGFLKPREP